MRCRYRVPPRPVARNLILPRRGPRTTTACGPQTKNGPILVALGTACNLQKTYRRQPSTAAIRKNGAVHQPCIMLFLCHYVNGNRPIPQPVDAVAKIKRKTAAVEKFDRGRLREFSVVAVQNHFIQMTHGLKTSSAGCRALRHPFNGHGITREASFEFCQQFIRLDGPALPPQLDDLLAPLLRGLIFVFADEYRRRRPGGRGRSRKGGCCLRSRAATEGTRCFRDAFFLGSGCRRFGRSRVT